MMKKFILKGKQLINKKLQEFQIDIQAVDYVNEQIPSKLKEPLGVLQRNIDLQETEKYEMYFKMYPTHHLSSFLLQKYKLLTQANTPSPAIILPKAPVGTDQAFIPKYDTELQNKALLLKEVVEQYEQGYYKSNDAIVCLSVVHFHHKRGAEIEYTYPRNKLTEQVENLVVHHSMPDSSHNKNEDYNFFNFEAVINGRKRMLFGVSYFKQIKVTEEHKEKNKELTRSYTQKAISVVSYLPLFGYLKMRLHSTVKVFFNDFDNFKLIQDAYKDLENHLVDTWPQISVNQLYIGSDLRTIINLFGPNDFYEIWKAVLYQKRIVVFAHSSSSASSFIMSLLTLFPGMSTFGVYSKETSKYMQGLREYALPLKIFSSANFMSMSFHIQDFQLLAPFQKNTKGSFLVGTTNRLLKQHNDYGVEMLVNLQNCTIEKRKLPHTHWESLSKRQKVFLQDLQDMIQREKTVGYGSSEDNIRNHFHNFLKESLLKIMTGIKEFKKFIVDCREYEKETRSSSKKRKSSKNLKSNDDGEELNQEDEETSSSANRKSNSSNKGEKDFPPVIPEQVTTIPFAQLILSPSFQFFLQFHNENLPELIRGKVVPGLLIENYKYYLKLEEGRFAVYDWNEKKLSFGKGNPKSFEGKEIRFYKHFEEVNELTKEVTIDKDVCHVKSVFIGIIENNKYSKNGYFIDKTEIYQGDFSRGVKQGYGKLTNAIHKYIGNFEQDLYSGQGQLVTEREIYVGEFREGLRFGCGKNQSYQQGLNYDGEWVNDKPEGNGIMKNQENTEIIGVFYNGKVDETCEVSLRYQDGRIYKGLIKDGKQNGQGFIVDTNGKLTMGEFKDGELIQEISGEKEQVKENKIEQQVQQQIIENSKQILNDNQMPNVDENSKPKDEHTQKQNQQS